MSVFSNTDRPDYTDLTLSLFLFNSFHLVVLRIQIEPVILTLDLQCFYILLYLFNLFNLCSLFFYFIKIGIWLIRVEYLVAVHYCQQVFGVGEVDDVVCVTREHDDRLYLVATNFIV